MAKGGTESAGFTIVETLIVLAVSAALASSMIVLTNGRQNKTQFMVAANSMKQTIEQIISETSNGYYQNKNDFNCIGSAIPGHAPSINNTPPLTGQGSNTSCIFLGKAIQFGIATGSANATQSFATYPLVANRYSTGTTEVTDFAGASPVALADDGNGTVPAGINYTQNYTTKNGLSLDHATYNYSGGPTSKTYAVLAIVDQLGQYAVNAQGDLDSSVQSLDLYDYNLDVLKWPSAPGSATQLVADINKGIDTAHVVTSVELCFNSGSTDQSAGITITGQGQLAVTLRIYGSPACV